MAHRGTGSRDLSDGRQPTRVELRSCIAKSRLSDEAAARAVAMNMIERGLVPRGRAWVYGCRYCRGWHITTRGAGHHLTAGVTATDPYSPPEYAQ